MTLSRLSVWKKRFGIMADQKPTVQVQTTSRLETMTVTQEWRFKQLQRFRSEETWRRKEPASRAWYTLAEAGERLASTRDELLRAAAAGDIACYVSTDGLRGRWGAQGDDVDARAGRADVSHLRLTQDACREVAAYGSANVQVLRHPTIKNKGAQFLLEEPLWVAPERILLKHPLPVPGRQPGNH